MAQFGDLSPVSDLRRFETSILINWGVTVKVREIGPVNA